MNDALRPLRVVLAAACTGSFATAVESRLVTQSALSSLINEIEGGMGFLFRLRSIRWLTQQVR